MKKIITYKDIKTFFNNTEEIGVPIDYNDTILNFIGEYKYNDKFDKKKLDIFKILLREEYLSKKDLRLFSIWCAKKVQPIISVFCAKKVQHLIKDEKSLNALQIAERYAYGLANIEELIDARKHLEYIFGAVWIPSDSDFERTAAMSSISSVINCTNIYDESDFINNDSNHTISAGESAFRSCSCAIDVAFCFGSSSSAASSNAIRHSARNTAIHVHLKKLIDVFVHYEMSDEEYDWKKEKVI